MCKSHHALWLRKMKKAGAISPVVPTEQRLLDVMPGSYTQIAEKAEHGYAWVQRTVDQLHAAGKVHVSGYLPPDAKSGSRWVQIFSAGPGKDKKVTPRQKYEHAMARRRQLYAMNRDRNNRPSFASDPLLGAMFGARPAPECHPQN